LTSIPSEFLLCPGKKNRPVASAEVLDDPRLQPVLQEQLHRRPCLGSADFHRCKPVWRKKARNLRREPANGIKSLRPRKKGLFGLVLGDACTKRLVFGDIRRIAEDEIEGLVDPRGPVADLELGPLLEP